MEFRLGLNYNNYHRYLGAKREEHKLKTDHGFLCLFVVNFKLSLYTQSHNNNETLLSPERLTAIT
jgi:hypothetical protein